MAALDPVHWDDIVAVSGPPGERVEARIEAMADDLADRDAYDAVKAVHDSLAADPDANAGPPDQGEVFLVAYILERDGLSDPGDGPLPSVAGRRPDDETLRAAFWDPPRTMWWVAVRLGVHWSLVRYWLYEASIPLRERNFTPETLAEIRAAAEE